VASARPASSRWLFGPGSDLVLGCGLGYVAIVVLLLAVGTSSRAAPMLALTPLLSILTGTPHYGATLLRVYEKRSERQAYAFFAVYVTVVLWSLFYVGLYSVWLGSLLITLYLSWSPWHYSGQNYGIALLFLRRRGVEVTPGVKRLLYTSFLLSFGLTLLALHGASGPEGEYAAFTPYQGATFQLLTVGIPSPFWEIAYVAIGMGYLGVLVAAGALLLRRARPGDLLPSAVLVLTQMLWFSVPPVARWLGLMGPDQALSSNLAAYAFIWIATGHSVQYLWVTTYYSAREEPWSGRGVYLLKALLAGSFIWGVPALLYTASVEGSSLGGVARDQDVFLVVAAVVNLHHFVLDGAIWKLRDGRVARVLIRREGDARPAPIEPEAAPRRWLAPMVYALGGILTVQVLVGLYEKEGVLRPAVRSGNLIEARESLERLQRIRSDSAADYLMLGRAALRRGDAPMAREALRGSIAKRPTPEAWVALGQLAKQQGRSEKAAAAYQQALALEAEHPTALYLLGETRLGQGRVEEAVERLARAAELLPGDERVQAAYRRATREANRASDGG